MEAILYSCIRKESDTLSVPLSLPRRLQTYLVEILVATSDHVCPSDRDPKKSTRRGRQNYSKHIQFEWRMTFQQKTKEGQIRTLILRNNLILIWTGQIRKAAFKFRVILVPKMEYLLINCNWSACLSVDYPHYLSYYSYVTLVIWGLCSWSVIIFFLM